MSEANDGTRRLLGSLIDAAVRDPEEARRLARQHPGLLAERWTLGETALHFLCIEGPPDAVRCLLEAGANPNDKNQFGDTPLIDAVALGRADVGAVLLKHGADPNVSSPTKD